MFLGAKLLYNSLCLSVCPSVRPSVHPSVPLSIRPSQWFLKMLSDQHKIKNIESLANFKTVLPLDIFSFEAFFSSHSQKTFFEDWIPVSLPNQAITARTPNIPIRKLCTDTHTFSLSLFLSTPFFYRLVKKISSNPAKNIFQWHFMIY